MSRDSYAYEKLWIAVDVLATGSSDLRTRIQDAVIPGMVLLPQEHFSDAADWAEYLEIKSKLTSREAVGSEGKIAASLAAMSDEECKAVARQIVNLCLSLHKKDDLE